MEHDYYAILGISESADAAMIRAAYFRRARDFHPDRGGSHAQMVLLNEAWEVLSDVDSRRHYDALRTGRDHGADAATFEQEKQKARERAAEYPLDWAAFEAWLQSAARQFTTANYGKSVFDLETPHGGSLTAFIVGGGCVGLVIGVMLAISVGQSEGSNGWRNLAGGVVTYAFIGGLLGKGLHYVLASGLHLAGVGAAGSAMKLTELDKWKLVSAAGIGAIGLLLIGEWVEMKVPTGINRADALRLITETLWQNVRYGAARGGILGALFGYKLASTEARRAICTTYQRKLVDGVSGPAAVVGGVAFAIAGAVCAFHGYLHGSGISVYLRIVMGSAFGALLCGIILVMTKKSILRESLGTAENPMRDATSDT